MNTADYLVSLGIEFERVYSSGDSMDFNHLSLGALRQLDAIIDAYKYQTAAHNFRIDLPNIVNLSRSGSDWSLYSVHNKTFGVRYADYVKEIGRGLKLPGDLVASLSETAKRFKGVDVDGVKYDLVVGSDWSPGEFGESRSSCWWTDYDPARRQASYNGDLCALRFWDEGSGVGRCWVWYVDGELILFNAYHLDGMTLESMARVLVNHLGTGWDSAPVPLRSSGRCLWINNDKGIAVTRDLGGLSSSRYYTLEVDGLCRCDACDNFVVYDDLIAVSGGEVCESCFESFYVRCDECDEYFHTNDMRYHDGYAYCEECFLNNFSLCEECGEYFGNDELTDGLCSYCSERLAVIS